MPRILCNGVTFTKKVAIEMPTIPNLQFATFFGDGSLNARDGTNAVAGGSTFANIGSGPVYQKNYASVTPTTNSLSTGMGDGYPAWTIIAAAAQVSTAASTLVGFGPTTASSVVTMLNAIINAGNITTFNVGATASLPSRPLFPVWHLYGFVSVVGSPFTIYDLTTGESDTTSTNIASTGGRPAAGAFEIGATTPSPGFTHPLNVAFALGAQTGLTLTALNAIAASLRYPLKNRGIIV